MERASSGLDKARQHIDYADICPESRYRLDTGDVMEIVADLPEERRDEVIAKADQIRRRAPEPENRTPARTKYATGEPADDVHQQLDLMSILWGGFVALGPSSPDARKEQTP